MCKVISGEVIIGNFLIETLNKDKDNIELVKLFEFDKNLSKSLSEMNCITNFDSFEIESLQNNFIFVDTISLEKNRIIINKKDNNTKKLWERCFRIGLPIAIIKEMEKAYSTI